MLTRLIAGLFLTLIYSITPSSAELIPVSANGGNEISNSGVTQGDHLLQISADGSKVFFVSASNNLVPSDTNGAADIFVKDLRSGEIHRVNVSASGIQADADAGGFDITPNGRYVAFESRATNLLPNANPNGEHTNIYVKDLETGKVSRVTTDKDGKAEGENIDGSGAGSRHFKFRGVRPSISNDGRFVAFRSETSTFLGLGTKLSFLGTPLVVDINQSRDIYVKDVQTGTIVRASSDADWDQICEEGGDRCGRIITDASEALISANSQFVVFAATFNNLVPNDTNGVADIFVKDLISGNIQRVNVNAEGTQDDTYTISFHWISEDGRRVAFSSTSRNLVANDTNDRDDVFLKNLDSGEITRINSDESGSLFPFVSTSILLTPSGDFAAFITDAPLVAEDTNEQADIYRKDLTTGKIVRVSTDANQGQVTGEAFFGFHDEMAMSHDGRFIAFRSTAGNLIGDPENNRINYYIKDLESGEVQLLTQSTDGLIDGESSNLVLSGDGSTAAFYSAATNLVPADDNSRTDVFAATAGTVIAPPEQEPDFAQATTESTANCHLCTGVGEPINTYNGELYEPLKADIDLGGPMPLFFRRYYSAFLRRSFILGDLGSNWRHNFDARLFVVGNTAKYVSHEGRVVDFLQEGVSPAWVQQTQLDTPYQLQTPPGSDGVLYDPVNDRIYTFNLTTNNQVQGKLVQVADGKGNVHTITYKTENGQLESVVDGLGRVLSFFYNDDRIPKISIVTDGTRSVAMDYQDPIDSEHLTHFTDVLGGVTEYTYEDTSATADHALLTRWKRPKGNVPFQQVFDDHGRVIQQTDSDGNTIKLQYNTPETNQTTLTDPLGTNRIHYYEPSGAFSGMLDQEGDQIGLTTNNQARRASITDRLGDITSYEYHQPSGRLSEVIHGDGSVTRFEYESREIQGLTIHESARTVYDDGGEESYDLDAFGNLTEFMDQEGNTATFTYNERSQLLSLSPPASGTTTFAYRKDATLESVTDPAANTTRFGYDELRRVNRITYPDSATVSFSYDLANNLRNLTDENGNTTRLTYDANGNLETIEKGLDPSGIATGRTTRFEYDNNDRLIAVTDPMDGTQSLTYHSLGGVETLTDANGSKTVFGYDSRGRLSSVTDPLENTRTFSYDDEDVPSSETDPLGNTTTFESDKMGRLTRVSSPLGNSRSAAYDSQGRITRTTDGTGGQITLSRDARGLLTGIELPGSDISISYTRDESGRISEIRDPGGHSWRRTYDNNGRLVSSADPLNNVRNTTYDSRNRPVEHSYPQGIGSLKLAYDAAGRLTSRVYSDGTEIHYSYTSNGRLASAGNGFETTLANRFDANDRNINCNGIAATYDAAGRVTRMTFGADKAIVYAYDANGRLIRVTDWAGGVTTFAYDAAGKLISINRPNSINRTISYDADSRLTGIAEGAIASIALSRNTRGDIVKADRNVPRTASTEGLTDNERSFDQASHMNGSVYDAMGRLTESGEDAYRWDLASRLLEYVREGNTVSCEYDAAGFRTLRASEERAREYVWNYILDLPSISIERQESEDLRYYIHAPDGALLYRIEAETGARQFYHFDEMGNTSFITDDAGTVVAAYAYTPYGEPTGPPFSVIDNPFTWQGEFGCMDEGNGLYYLRARYYDSRQARFISRDPIKGLGPKNSNPYQYADANPMRYIDPTGRQIDYGDFRLGLAPPGPYPPESSREASAIWNALRQGFGNQLSSPFPGLYSFEPSPPRFTVSTAFTQLRFPRARRTTLLHAADSANKGLSSLPKKDRVKLLKERISELTRIESELETSIDVIDTAYRLVILSQHSRIISRDSVDFALEAYDISEYGEDFLERVRTELNEARKALKELTRDKVIDDLQSIVVLC